MSNNDELNLVNSYISQVYLLHNTGMVEMARIYSENCVNSDPQLIGGFIAAIFAFLNVSGNDVVKSCPGSHDGKHRLRSINSTCSQWYISQNNDFLSALLIPNTSPLIKNDQIKLIERICNQLLETFILFKNFTMSVVETNSTEDEIGNTLDYIIKDSLSDFTDRKLKFDKTYEKYSYKLIVDDS